VEQTIAAYGHRYDQARYQGAVYTTQFLDDLLAAFAHLGMSSRQEEEILEMVKDRSNKLVDLYDIAGEAQAHLGDLIGRLESILDATAATTKRQPVP
jgi:hypothetical protein